MKGKRGDVADRHTLAVSGVYCVSWCSSIMLYCSSSHWSPQAGHRQCGGVCERERERGGRGVHKWTHKHTLWQKAKAFSSTGCACLLLCVSLISLNQTVCIVRFISSFQACLTHTWT